MTDSLISFSLEADAHRVRNYLVGEGIDAKVETDQEGRFHVTVSPQWDLPRARVLCEEVLRHPNDERIQQASWQHGEGLHSAPVTQGRRARKTSWLKTFLSMPFTGTVLIACVLVFVLSFLGLFSTMAHSLMLQPLPVLWQSQQWWRVIGPVFIHFSVMHILFNCLWWIILGRQVEQRLGSSMLITLFLVTAVLSNGAQLLVSGPNFGGLSGVVYGLFGFVWWLGWLRPSWGLSIQPGLVVFMLIWLVLGYTGILWVNVANTAHTVGLISGCALAGLLSLGQSQRDNQL